MSTSGISLEDEYKKDTGITPQDVATLRQWLKTQPHLPEEHITDLDLILVYHCSNRSFSVAKQVLDLHYTLKTLFTSYFKNRLVDDSCRRITKTSLITILPTRAYDGNAILYACLLHNDPKPFNSEEFSRAMFMVIDLWQHKEGTWPGLLLVIDFKNVTMGHIAKIEIQTARNVLYFLQEAMFLKVKGFHYINAPSYFDKFLMIIRPFLKQEMLDILFIHTVRDGLKGLEKILPITALPKDVGGEYKTTEECQRNNAKIMEENADFFVQENKKRVNEAVRPGKQKTISDIFGGVEGSFKSLSID